MQPIKVSIIVPVHDSEAYLEECVASIRKQSLRELEIILVENASTDGSLALCRKLADEDERIRYSHLDVGDLSTARNHGVELAQADYVGFIDSDDLIQETMFEDMYRLACEQGLDTVICNYARYKNPRTIRYQYREDHAELVMEPKELVALNMKETVSQSACTMLVRKSIAEEHPFPPFRYFEDRYTTFKFLAASSKCGYICTSYYRYLQYRGGICRTKTFRRNRDFAISDIERLTFILESGMFSAEEIPLVAAKSSESLLRKINRMKGAEKNAEEIQEYEAIKRKIVLIPEHTALSLKARIIRYFINKKQKSL